MCILLIVHELPAAAVITTAEHDQKTKANDFDFGIHDRRDANGIVCVSLDDERTCLCLFGL